MPKAAGTPKTKDFYDTEGWHTTEDGHLVDVDLFGFKENGDIRKSLFRAQWAHVHKALESMERPVDLLECGCGGSPDMALLPYCSRYTGVDFSETGINVAKQKFSDVSVDHEFQVADACNLPFEDARFDVVYSAHMLYHIEDAAAQKKALEEFLRVVKPGGRLILNLANPRPMMFPLRALKRIVADTPVLNTMSNKVRAPGVLPYNPQTIGWTRKILQDCADIKLVSGGMASTWFNQNVSEMSRIGRPLWRAVQWLETRHPRLAAHLGNYVIYIVEK